MRLTSGAVGSDPPPGIPSAARTSGGAAIHPAAGTVLPLLVGLLASGGCAAAGGVVGSADDVASPRDGEPASEYHLYVANESSDVVSHVAFEPGADPHVVNEIDVGVMPGDIDGPHGIAVSPDGDRWYVTLAHGTPYGSIWAFSARDDALIGRTDLGRFPATIEPAADGRLLVISNFDLHGDPTPSELSVVHAPELTEITRIPTCVTPHGGRVDASGARHYSVCMGSDQLVEVSLASFRVSRRLSLRPGAEGPLPVGDRGTELPLSPDPAVCSPTWVAPGAGERAERWVYVACNGSGDVLEVDVEAWEVARRFQVGSGPYNLAVTPGGDRVVATLKAGQAIAVIDLSSGEVEARLETSRPVTHGVVVDPLARYAFVTNESVGSVRGTLDVFDLDRMERLATLELEHQPGGIGLRTSR